MTDLPRLLLVTDRTQTGNRRLEHIVGECVRAGFRHVLLRDRDLAPEAYDDLLERVRRQIGDAATLFTREPAQDAVGCHLAEHAPWPGVRPTVVGRSVHDVTGVRRAALEGVDYVLAGPFAPTASKPGYGPALGLDGIRALLRVNDCPPLLAIGGVGPEDVAPLASVGAHGIAVMGSLMRAADPAALASEYVAAAASRQPARSVGP